MTLVRKAVAELVGTAFLVAAVIGSWRSSRSPPPSTPS
jgi:glycerol uptake facilitator-like aquaporin